MLDEMAQVAPFGELKESSCPPPSLNFRSQSLVQELLDPK